MSRESTATFYKTSIAVLGGVCFLLALFNIKAEVLTWKFVVLFIFTVLLAPRMSIILPRSKYILSFSDSMIFLSFLLFGGEAAIIIATTEIIANYLYFKFKGIEFARYSGSFNIGATSLSTAITYFVWSWIPRATNIDPTSASTSNLITTLGILALTQFFASSAFASIYYSLKTGANPWQAWKKEGFSISVTHFAGACLAGLVSKLLNYGDTSSIAVSLITFAIIYYNYRQIIEDMTQSIEQAEQAERDKAGAEREKRFARPS